MVEAEFALLSKNGVDVARHIVENAEIDGLPAKVRAFAAVRNNPAVIAPILNLVGSFAPDVVHIHNFFPLISPGIHGALAQANVPTVQTLHNYRLLCANGMFLRKNQVCENCISGSRLNALRHRCYRGSVIGSAAVLAMQNAAIGSRHWVNNVGRFIALTEFGRRMFVDNGLPADKVVVKPNFIVDPGIAPGIRRSGGLFVGRLAPGKGVDTLLEAWRGVEGIPLTIIGDGPDAHALRKMAPANVTFTGALPKENVLAAMARAQLMVLPSTWYEGFPMTLVEALACGLPIAASRIGGIPEIIEDGKNGLLFDPGDPLQLRSVVNALFKDQGKLDSFARASRARYCGLYSEEANFGKLMAIYNSVIGI